MVERHNAVIMVTEREAQSYDCRQKEVRHPISRHDVLDLPNARAEIWYYPPPREEVKQANCKQCDNRQRNKFWLEWPLYWKPNVVSCEEKEQQADSDCGME